MLKQVNSQVMTVIYSLPVILNQIVKHKDNLQTNMHNMYRKHQQIIDDLVAKRQISLLKVVKRDFITVSIR